MALPLFFLSGCASLSIDKDFFQPSKLTIIISHHTNTAVCNTVSSLGLAKGVEGYQCKWDARTLCLHLAY